MGWSYPRTIAGALAQGFIITHTGAGSYSQRSFTLINAGNHDIIVAEPLYGQGDVEIIGVRNRGNGRYYITIRARVRSGRGTLVCRLHGESVN